MIDLENEKNIVYIGVYPFINLVASKEQGMKVLEEASECREAYDQLAKVNIYNAENPEEADDNMLDFYVNNFVEEACDVLQATVNLLVSVFGTVENAQRAIVSGMSEVVGKNAERGYYGEYEEDIDDEENDKGVA